MSTSQLTLGVCDYPEHVAEGECQKHAEMQREIGLSVVRLAEFGWAKMEPSDGQFCWQWLDDAIATYEAQGLKIILGTPTATPPAWLIHKHPEILPANELGVVKKFGSRRHYDYASGIYRGYVSRIVTEMAQRYGEHPAVVGWQIDNEHGHEGTAFSYGQASAKAFPGWLKQRYGSLEALNEAWGTVFWSQEYSDWQQIDTPAGTAISMPNPSHVLDYKRFCSDIITSFQEEQIEILRRMSPDRFITHNFVILSSDSDLYRLTEQLDFVAWDSYPIGMLEFFATWESEENKTRYARIGHPDIVSVNHDIYRGMKKGKPFWIMEQQCGQANWAQYNPIPSTGAVKLWTAHAWAHGAEGVVYFRWRAAHMAQEMMHSGLLKQDGSPDRGYAEVAQLDPSEFPIGGINNKVVILHDYASLWMYEQQKHNQDMSYWRQFMRYYATIKQLGIDVDILHPSQLDPSQYDVVVAPCLLVMTDDIAAKLQEAAQQCQLILGPRCGFYDFAGKVPQEGQYQGLRDLVGVKLGNVDSLRPTLHTEVQCHNTGKVHQAKLWCESYELIDAQPTHFYQTGPMAGLPAVTQKGNTTVIGAHSRSLLKQIFKNVFYSQKVKTYDLPDGVRLSKVAGETYIFNFNEHPIVWGGQTVLGISWHKL